MPNSRALGLLFLISGCLGLLIEQVFEKLLSTLLGASMPAASVVLAVYFLGLSAGSLGYGRWLQPRFRNPVLAYAAMEGAVAMWGLLLYATLDQRYFLFEGFLRAAAGHGWTLALARGAVALCWILPPTFCMGATFPAIKDMANFVEPYLPPGFRTRLQRSGGTDALPAVPAPSMPSGTSDPSLPANPAAPDTKQ